MYRHSRQVQLSWQVISNWDLNYSNKWWQTGGQQMLRFLRWICFAIVWNVGLGYRFQWEPTVQSDRPICERIVTILCHQRYGSGLALTVIKTFSSKQLINDNQLQFLTLSLTRFPITLQTSYTLLLFFNRFVPKCANF